MPKQKTAKKQRKRPLHKRIALHPVSIFVILCAGVIIVASTLPTKADTYVVTAKVAASAVTSAATITSYQDQQHTTDQNATISGTCSVDTAYVELLQNDTISGTSECNGGFYSIQTLLQPGANRLQAVAFNSTDDQGPVLSPIVVFYDAPVVSAPVPTPSQSQSVAHPQQSITSPTPDSSHSVQPANIAPLVITYDYKYQLRSPGEPWHWDLKISGGTQPYNLDINWGDGSRTVTQNVGATPSVDHAYNRAGIFHSIVRVIDTNGTTASLQLLAIVQSTAGNPITTGILQDIRANLWIILPSYAVVTLMVASFWLGESQAAGAVLKISLGIKHWWHR